jgi:hypothetical protein
LRSEEGVMVDPNEKRIREEIDREVSDKGGLIALVLCLVVAIGLLVAGTLAFLQA